MSTSLTPTPQYPCPGLALEGGLVLVRCLGEGGMGSVWVAHKSAEDDGHAHRDTREVCELAVKFMSPALAQKPEAIERFRREVQAASLVKNPHVVEVLGHGVHPQLGPYLIMDRLYGENLQTRLERACLSLDEARDLVTQTCSALEDAHAASVIHRDIKPENLFLVAPSATPSVRERRTDPGLGPSMLPAAPTEGARGHTLDVKVLDFGIAKAPEIINGSNRAREWATNTSTTMGTPHFMSPEHAFDIKAVEARSDLWSFAVVVYYALTGSLPFNGETFASVCLAIHHATFARATTLRPDLPPGLNDWFSRAFARSPADRFPSAKAMADAFEHALDAARVEQGSRAPRHSLAGSFFTQPPPPRRRIAGFVAAGGLLAGVAVGCVVMLPGIMKLGSASTAVAEPAERRALSPSPVTLHLAGEPGAATPASAAGPAPGTLANAPSLPDVEGEGEATPAHPARAGHTRARRWLSPRKPDAGAKTDGDAKASPSANPGKGAPAPAVSGKPANPAAGAPSGAPAKDDGAKPAAPPREPSLPPLPIDLRPDLLEKGDEPPPAGAPRGAVPTPPAAVSPAALPPAALPPAVAPAAPALPPAAEP